MAGLFRSSRQPAAPPTAYPRGLQPVASLDSSKLSVNISGARSPSPRLSRADLDFEAALRGDNTVRLREGLDVTSLGITTPERSSNPDPKALNRRNPGPDSRLNDAAKTLFAPSPSGASSNSDDMTPTPTPSKPANMLIVVPPTPEVIPKYQSQSAEGQSRSGTFFKAQAAAASTPDLRKNGSINNGMKSINNNLPVSRDQYSSTFLSPSQSNATMKPRLRGSSSTSSFSMVSAASFASPKTPVSKDMSKPYETDHNSQIDWGLTNPRSRSGSKTSKSMRVRATNFLGKMLGQDTSRDKSQKLPASPSPGYVAPPLFARYASQNPNPPPVPQLPERFQSNAQRSSSSTDVPPSSSPCLDFSKPLPRQPKASVSSSEEMVQDFLFSDSSSQTPVVDTTIKSHHTRAKESVSSARRRSSSVGDVEWQKTSTESMNSQTSFKTAETSSIASRPSFEMRKASAASIEWDTNDIMRLFKGELSQLDPISSTPLEITDPSSPERQLSNRSRSNTIDQILTPRSEGSAGTIRPRLSETSGRPGPLGINTALDTLNVDVDATGSTAMKRSPVSASSNRSSISVPDSPLRNSTAAAVRRNVSRPTVPPVSASALYASSRAASSPLLGVPGSSSPRTHNTAPPSFTNPFPTQPSVVVSSSTPNRRTSVQPRAGASSSEPVLTADETDLRRRSSQPHSLNVEGGRTVRLVHSHASISYPFSPSMSQVDLVADVSPSKSIASTSSLARGVSFDGEGLEVKGKELASRCWKDDETFLPKEKIAEWLGGAGRLNAIALNHYIEFYDFTGLKLDHAFRRFCAKLYLKGETQQIDRILSEFSRRFWECNPNSIYGSASVVHAVTYSILLLNTDLHVADLSTHMSRNQFVRNTLQAVQAQNRPQPSLARASTPDLTYDDASSTHARSDGSDIGGSTLKSPKRSSSVHSWTSISRENLPPSQVASPLGPPSQNASSISVQTPTSGSMSAVNEPRIRTSNSQSSSVSSIPYGRNWDLEMENILRDIYAAVKAEGIRQPAGFQIPMNQSSTLAPGTPYNTLLRHRNSQRGQDRMAMLKRGSIRGLQTLLHTGVSPYSSNSSIDFRDSRDGRVSPSPSFATSMDGAINSAFYAPALGFASNLSHTIIRETQEDDVRSLTSDGSADTTVSISEEELALLGAPWAKEGMLCRKQYWESTGKRAKSKSWQDVFVVIQKGDLDMFIFGERGAAGGQNVGGGNWLANAQSVGKLHLAHSLAHVLPPPGYNRQRPYCFVLTLANGGVYFFQAGTEDLLNEWVSTCNYWAARQSKEPLSGGVSNMEYGWNRVLDPLTHISTIQDDARSSTDKMDSFSVRSGKSGGKKRSIPDAATVGRTYDRILIHEWKPPLPSSVPSMHDEETQLEALQRQVELLNNDLQFHNELRSPMSVLYAPRSANFLKAQTNWERKSQYLLTEIVKYQTYVESLRTAMTLRLTKRGEKALEKALKTRPDDSDFRAMGQSKSNLTDSPVEAETVMGHEDSEEEVTTPGADTVEFQHNKL